jgi:hypothetical protein
MLRKRLMNQSMLTFSIAAGALKGGGEKGGGGSDPVAEAESCFDMWQRSWLVVSWGFLWRDLYPSMMKAAMTVEKRPVCRSSLDTRHGT